MKLICSRAVIVCLILGGLLNPAKLGAQNYLDPRVPVEQRVEDLLSRMTLHEKVGQMNQYVGPERVNEWFERRGLNTGDNQSEFYATIEEIKNRVRRGEIGSFLFVSGPQEANLLQGLADQTRLKIPLLIAIDAIHGHAMFPSGGTAFPTSVGLSCSWDIELAGRIADVTASEMAATGFNWNFFPTVDILRDPRWGRTGETFGEDPLLVSMMSDAFVRGLQEHDPPILACSKAFLGGSQPLNGLNFAPTDVSERTLYEVFYPPYLSNIKAGVGSIMVAHNEVNGIPMHANKQLITGFLREEAGFDGIIISDWEDIFRLEDVHYFAETRKDAVRLAVQAGIDIHMHGPGFLEPLIELVEQGIIAESRIDDSVRRILRAKFKLGLFENRYVDEDWKSHVLTKESRALALESAEKSIVLLKNENNTLPLTGGGKKIFVTGPNANNHALLGDWSLNQHPDSVTNVLEGLERIFGDANDVMFYDSGKMLDMGDLEIQTTARQAQNADVIIAVIGGDALRVQGNIRTYGENIDRPSINLPGRQLDLVKALHQTGKPVIVVFITGRPTAEPWISDNIPAIVYAWEPGQEGGAAIANILSGKVNPSAKLTMTIPRSAGHLPAWYNHKPAMYFRPYRLEATAPLYAFGYGLSYSSYVISEPVLEKEVIAARESVGVVCRVKNTGSMAGEKIVQLYIRDNVASVTRPVKELKAFEKVWLEPGEEKTLRFQITPEMLAFYDINMDFVVEPGAFTIMLGSSSRDEDLKKARLTVTE